MFGLPRRRLDQLRQPASTSMAPGSSSIVRARYVIVYGPGSGVFLYNGVPGPGNIPIGWVSNSATDPFGNILPGPGIVSYSSANGNFTQIYNAIFQLGNANLAAPFSISQSGLIGGATRLVSQKNNAGDTAAEIDLIPSASGSPLVATTPVVAWQPTLTGNAVETWHSVTPPANTSGTLRYRLMPDNTVMVHCQLTVTTSAAAGTLQLITLPTGYVPAADCRGPVGYFTNSITIVTNLMTIVSMRWEATTGGNFQVLGFPGGAVGTGVTELCFVVVFPLT